MNAQHTQNKKLTQLATAVALALAFGTVGAANVITFEGESGVDNGLNNAADINASTATNAAVTIRQINTTTGNGFADAAYNVATAAGMNQVGDYVGAANPLVIGAPTAANTLVLKIGQGASIDNETGAFNAGATGSKGNIVAGKIDATAASTLAYISQTGAAGARTVFLGTGPLGAGTGLTGGTLKATQSGSGDVLDIKVMSGGALTTSQTVGTTQTINVTSMTGGTLTASQTGNTEILNVTAMTNGTTNIYQGQKGGSGDVATSSTLWFDSGLTGVAVNYATVDVYQTGSYQQTHLTYENGGYSGTVNLDQHGTAAVVEPATPATYATLDLHL
jgi:hypothetical protein